MGVGVGAGGGVGYEFVQHLDCNLPTYRLLAPVQSPVRGRSQLLLRLIIHVVCRLDAPCYEAPMRTPAAAAGRCRLRQWGHPATRALDDSASHGSHVACHVRRATHAKPGRGGAEQEAKANK